MSENEEEEKVVDNTPTPKGGKDPVKPQTSSGKGGLLVDKIAGASGGSEVVDNNIDEIEKEGIGKVPVDGEPLDGENE